MGLILLSTRSPFCITLALRCRVQSVHDNSLQTDPRRAKRRRFTTKRAKAMEADKEMPRLRLAREAAALQQARVSCISLPQPTFIPLASQEAGQHPRPGVQPTPQLSNSSDAVHCRGIPNPCVRL